MSVMRRFSARVKTLTYDNGYDNGYDNSKKFALRELIALELNAKGYFAHPYHAWERGLKKNTNGLIRPYLSKEMSLDALSQHIIQFIMDRLNNRPKKCLNMKISNFFGIKPPIALVT